MTRVLVCSHTTGYQLRAFDAAAERLGIELVFATDRCHALDDPWQDRAVAVKFHDLDASVAAIVAAAGARAVQGIVAVGDRPVVLAAVAAEALGLPWHAIEGARASTDKRRSRTALAGAGLPSPAFAVLSMPAATARATDRAPSAGAPLPPFPVVVKPVGLSGSRGVIRANDAAEFAAAVERVAALLARPAIRAARAGLEDDLLVEAYIDGLEFAVEGVMTRGRFTAFAIFDKPDALVGPFFEETIYVTPSRASAATQSAIVDHVGRAAHALGLIHGPIHAECRVTRAGEIYMLEVAGRPIGGLCSRVLAFEPTRAAAGQGAEVGLEDVLLRHAIGTPIDELARVPRASAVMMIPIPKGGLYKKVEGLDAAREVPGIVDIAITAKRDQRLEPLPEAGSYLGFIFAATKTPESAEAALRRAHERLHFTIGRPLPITK